MSETPERYADWTFEQFHKATGLPQELYEEWLELGSEGDREFSLRVASDPQRLAFVGRVLGLS